MDILEQVQLSATKMIKGLKHPSDEERLRELQPLSLEKRKHRGILSVCVNINVYEFP